MPDEGDFLPTTNCEWGGNILLEFHKKYVQQDQRSSQTKRPTEAGGSC